jgi:hypothetical protein
MKPGNCSRNTGSWASKTSVGHRSGLLNDHRATAGALEPPAGALMPQAVVIVLTFAVCMINSQTS